MKHPSNWRIVVSILSLLMASLACIPPQDCMGTDFSVKGRVRDESGAPVSGAKIRAYEDECYEASAFDMTVASDTAGHFETDEVFRFACCEFNVEVSAEGYIPQSFIFYPPGEQWPDELPEKLTVTLEAR